jgi:transcriptional regulator with XRE-family HTH domain
MDEKQCSADFAKRMNTLRQQRGQSARDMSLSLGQAPNYMNNLESAKNYPAMKSFFYICEHFGITPQEFFCYEETDPVQAKELCNEFLKLDAKSRAYILGLMKEIGNRPK